MPFNTSFAMNVQQIPKQAVFWQLIWVLLTCYSKIKNVFFDHVMSRDLARV